MTKIVFIRPKMTNPEPMPYPHLGIGYMASILRKHGHEVHYIDCAIINKPYSYTISQVKRLNPDAIGLTSKSCYYYEMRKLAHLLRKLNIPIILGGVHPTIFPEMSLRECKADFAVLGEGELTILELMNLWKDKEARKSINGIAYLDQNKLIQNPQRELIENLDSLPLPAWDLIDPRNYPAKNYLFKVKRLPVATIFTTRGCPHVCDFCASTNFWKNTVRKRSAKNVVDEIEYLMNDFGVKEIQIGDDYFNVTKKHVIEICREVVRRKLDIVFSCPNGLRIETLDKKLLTIMRRAGFYAITIPIESGSQTILNNVHKKLNLKDVRKVINMGKSLGYFITGYIIFGLPGETYETARRSIQIAKSLPYDLVMWHIAKPLPGSKWFNRWSKGKDLEKINYDQFHFLEIHNVLEYSDGKRTLKLPIQAFREHFYRPRQMLRYLKYWVHTFHFSQSLLPFRRLFLEQRLY